MRCMKGFGLFLGLVLAVWWLGISSVEAQVYDPYANPEQAQPYPDPRFPQAYPQQHHGQNDHQLWGIPARSPIVYFDWLSGNWDCYDGQQRYVGTKSIRYQVDHSPTIDVQSRVVMQNGQVLDAFEMGQSNPAVMNLIYRPMVGRTIVNWALVNQFFPPQNNSFRASFCINGFATEVYPNGEPAYQILRPNCRKAYFHFYSRMHGPDVLVEVDDIEFSYNSRDYQGQMLPVRGRVQSVCNRSYGSGFTH